MANELKILAPTSGLTVYFLVNNSTNQVWNLSGAAFENYATANLVKYGIVATEQGTASLRYVASMPSGIPLGSYSIDSYVQSSGSPAEIDQYIGVLPRYDWNGTIEIPFPSNFNGLQINNSGLVSILSGTSVNVYSGQLSGQNVNVLQNFDKSGYSLTSNFDKSGYTSILLSGQSYLASGNIVLISSGQLSGQQVNLLSGNQVAVVSGTQVNVFSGQVFIASGISVNIFSGQLSGQPVNPLSGQTFLASGCLTIPYSGSMSGQPISLLSGQVVLIGSGQLSGQQVNLLSGNQTAVVSGTQVNLFSGQNINVYSGQLSGFQVNLLSGNQVQVWSGTQVNLFSGTNVNVYSGSLSGQQVNLLSGNQVSVYSGTSVNTFSGQIYLASGQASSIASGTLFIAPGQSVLVSSGQLSGQNVNILQNFDKSGYSITANFDKSGYMANLLSGQSYLASGANAAIGFAVLEFDTSGMTNAPRHCLGNASRKLTNTWNISGSASSGNLLTIFAEDGITPAYFQGLQSTSGSQPITEVN